MRLPFEARDLTVSPPGSTGSGGPSGATSACTGRGVLVVAHGPERYLALARNLAISLRLNSPGVACALVTDSSDPALARHFDHVIPIDPGAHRGYLQKLRMWEYTPFQRTLYVDSDCLVIRDIGPLFDRFAGRDVSVLGRVAYGSHHFMDPDAARTRYGVDWYPTFNGGLYYFEKSSLAQRVFEEAQRLIPEYDRLKMTRFSGEQGDEPLIALAMAIHAQRPIEDKPRGGMSTFLGIRSHLQVSVVRRVCAFRKYERWVEPAILHFGGGCLGQFHYRREVSKLRWFLRTGAPRVMVDTGVNAITTVPYVSYILAYRLLKALLRGAPLRLHPLLPTYRYL